MLPDLEKGCFKSWVWLSCTRAPWPALCFHRTVLASWVFLVVFEGLLLQEHVCWLTVCLSTIPCLLAASRGMVFFSGCGLASQAHPAVNSLRMHGQVVTCGLRTVLGTV
jgi:hypothetical protein